MTMMLRMRIKFKTKTKTKNRYTMKKKTSLTTVSIMLALVLGLVCLPSGTLAIRGIRTRRVLNEQQHRRTTQWKGVAKPSNRGSPKSEDEEDNNEEEIPEADERGFTWNGKKQGKKGGKKGKRVGDDDDDDSDEDTSLLLNEFECDDPSDPRCVECDDPSDPRCFNKEEVVVSSEIIEQEFINNLPPAFGEMDTGIPDIVHGNVGDHFGIGAGFRPNEPSLPDTRRHTIPPFKIVYSLGTVVDESDMDDGDYAELSVQTELYLTRYFTNHYLTEPTEFQEIDVAVQPTSEYWIVRLYVSPAFVVPGNVPSLQSLFDRIIDAFSGQHSKEYILLLNEMGTENPFRNTRSIALLNDNDATVVAAMGARNSLRNKNNTGLTSSENRPRFLTIIIAGGLLIFAIVGFFWAVQQRRRRRQEKQVRQLRLDEESRTAGYIASLRRRTPRYYRDEKKDNVLLESQTSTEPAEENDEEENNNADMADDDDEENHQTLAELRQAMEVLESLTSGGGGAQRVVEEPSADERMEYYPSPPSDGDGNSNVDEEGAVESSSSSSFQSHSEYLKYLDLQTSFEEEDLRVDD